MKLFSAAQMREADAKAAAAGVSTGTLMDAAGRGVAEALRSWRPAASHVIVLCGRGNNGGDGYVAGAELRRRGVKVTLCELEGSGSQPGDAADARTSFLAEGGSAELLTEHSYAALLDKVAAASTAADMSASPVVVDALFGTGLSRPLDGWLADLVTALGDSRAGVLSVDVPSGLNADLAEPIGPHVMADVTVQLAGNKPAALFYPNRSAYGRTEVLDIGIPPSVLEAASDIELLTATYLSAVYPHPDPAAHKYSAGTVCVVAGSPLYLGAAELACRGAWRGGAGLVTLVAQERLAAAWPETVFQQHDLRSWPPPGLERRRAGAMVVGPGLHEEALDQLGSILDWAPGAVVLDAAALTTGALDPLASRLPQARTVLTPHAGEAARLLEGRADGATGANAPDAGEAAHLLDTRTDGRTKARAPDGPEAGRVGTAAGEEDSGAALVKRDPLAAARALADKYHSVVVLKGPTTVICEPGGRSAVSTRGTPALASGGTGDVLAGLIAAQLAKPGGDDLLFERACVAVWLHGLAGELAAAEMGDALVASDVVARLPHAARHLASKPNS